jgi:hypothetical protein
MHWMHRTPTTRKNRAATRKNRYICVSSTTHIYINISIEKFGRHLKKCTERKQLTQSMLSTEERAKRAKGTARVRGKSYRQGTVYIRSRHKNIGQMEARCYDPRHHIINSNTKYHCGECCARMNKQSNSTETVKTTLTTAVGSKW